MAHARQTKNNENANRISDTIVAMAKAELAKGVNGSAVVVGVCLGLLGVLSGKDNNPVLTELIGSLKGTIASITGIGDEKIRFFDKPGSH